MIRKVCVLALLVTTLLVAETECGVHPLELSRMFTKVHFELLKEKAAEEAPGEHNHNIAQTLSLTMPSQFMQPRQQFSPNQFPRPVQGARPPVPTQQFQQPMQQRMVSPHLPVAQSMSPFSPKSVEIDNLASTSIEVSQKLMNDKLRNEPNPKQALRELRAPDRFCPFKAAIKCDPDFPYRTLDGSCNNLENFWWGKTETPFKRYMEADYSDQFKLNEPRISLDGTELPNARELACALNGEAHEIEPFITHIFMQWGQFINHDITSLSIGRDDDPDKTICNKCTRSKKCLPIPIRSNVTCNCINQMRHQCIEFTRSSASFGDVSCSLGSREQLNLQTAFIDGSAIYGVAEEELEKLRDRSAGKGQMLVQRRPGNRDLLPADMTPKPSDCLDFTEKTRCFHAGDDRVNQNPALMSFHTLFVREHNRIARILSSINPTWEDETVFQEARRVVIAMLQHITYNEYLPILLGPRIMTTLNLAPGRGGEQSNLYDKNIDPRIPNECSAAAGRFGHSMIRTLYSKLNSTYHSNAQSFMLRNSYFRANSLYDEQCGGGLESIVRGMLKDPLMKVDRWFTQELTQHLFEVQDKFGRPFHFDLVAINIHRGRDHGIPGYTKFREFCGLEPIRTWDDMKRFVSEDVVVIFQQFYKFVEDVELFLASISEFKEEGSIVGPTLTCLLGKQFRDLKFGDRFWYETAQSPAAFTPEQLGEIRKTSLSKFLCRTMVDTPLIQPRAMISNQIEDNGLVKCDDLPDINWEFWRTS